MKKILVIVDVQNDFIDGSLGTKEAKEIIPNIVEKINDNCYEKIFVTLDTHDINYLKTEEGRFLPQPHCVKYTKGWLINENILYSLSNENYKTIEKRTFGCEKLIRDIRNEINRSKIKQNDLIIELVGVCTDICVITNALMIKSHFPNIKVAIDTKCCAGSTQEAHEEAIRIMRGCMIDVDSCNYKNSSFDNNSEIEDINDWLATL